MGAEIRVEARMIMGVMHQQRPPSPSEGLDFTVVTGERFRRPAPARGLAVMENRRTDIEGAKAGLSEPEAQVDIVEIHREGVGVEASDRTERCGLDDEACRGDGTDSAGRAQG